MKMRRDMVTASWVCSPVSFLLLGTCKYAPAGKATEPGPRLLPFVALFLIASAPLL